MVNAENAGPLLLTLSYAAKTLKRGLKKTRKMSEATKAKLRAAAKARWAKINGNLTPVSTSPHAGREPIGFSVIDSLCHIYFSLSLFKKEVERRV